MRNDNLEIGIAGSSCHPQLLFIYLLRLPILAGSPQQCLKSIITKDPSRVPPSMRDGLPHDIRECGPYSLRIVCGFFKTSYSIYVWALGLWDELYGYLAAADNKDLSITDISEILTPSLPKKETIILIIPDQQLTTVRKKSDIIEEWPASKSNFNEAMIEINFTTRCLFLCKYTTIVRYHGIFVKNQKWELACLTIGLSSCDGDKPDLSYFKIKY